MDRTFWVGSTDTSVLVAGEVGGRRVAMVAPLAEVSLLSDKVIEDLVVGHVTEEPRTLAPAVYADRAAPTRPVVVEGGRPDHVVAMTAPHPRTRAVQCWPLIRH